MKNEVAKQDDPKKQALSLAVEQAITAGNLALLNAEQRLFYYNKVCESMGLNPLTRPFDFITLNGKLVMYAKKDATDQLRKIHGVSITKIEEKTTDGLFMVTAYAKDKHGKEDSDVGAVPVPQNATDRANALLKCVTKAKRRVTLSICGLGVNDESEYDTVPEAQAQILAANAKVVSEEKTAALQRKLGSSTPQDQEPVLASDPSSQDGHYEKSAPAPRAPERPHAAKQPTKEPEVLPAAEKPSQEASAKPKRQARGAIKQEELPPIPEADALGKIKVPTGMWGGGLILDDLSDDVLVRLRDFCAKGLKGADAKTSWFAECVKKYAAQFDNLPEVDQSEPAEVPPPPPPVPAAAQENYAGEYFERPSWFTEPMHKAFDGLVNANDEAELKQAWLDLQKSAKDPVGINLPGMVDAGQQERAAEFNKKALALKDRQKTALSARVAAK